MDLAPNELGEGPVWLADRGELAWVDIQRGFVYLLEAATGRVRTIPVGELVGAIAPTVSRRLVAAVATGFVLVDVATGAVRRLATLERVDPTIRMKDGKADHWGRVWAGTMGLDKRPGGGTLYRLDPDLTVTTMVEPVTISNGLDWSDDRRTMVYVDTPTQRVDRFDLAGDGLELTNRQAFVAIPLADGAPDGLTIDAAGRMWLALWGGNRVNCYSPDGQLEATIRVPANHVTSCTFGGPDLSDLYITSARAERTPEELAGEPLAGRLFHCRPGAIGRPANRFDDSRLT
ncbi:MAG: SMP-30/gluconolactonase/LRE family protein [Candidatus Limnocylindrales bacterium]